MQPHSEFQGLIIDIGVSEGNDTAYYLQKGFRVIAVEADPDICKVLKLRFEREIASGAVILLNRAASDRSDSKVEFFSHGVKQGVSSIHKRGDVDQAGYTKHCVETIDWRSLRSIAGVPRYLKIDIEKMEELFLRGMSGETDLPEFLSLECYLLRPCEMLFELGYTRFRILDQQPKGGFKLPSEQKEGLTISSAEFTHSSGPFGLDVFLDERWLSFEGFRIAWDVAATQMHRTWFDCHAWKPR